MGSQLRGTLASPPAMNDWLHAAGDDVILRLHIQPGAKKTEVAGRHGDALKIRLAAPPVEGKANEVLIHFLAAKLGCGRAAVEILQGERARSKRVRIRAVTPAAVRVALEA